MKTNKFDYDHSTFVTINTPDGIKYFMKVNEHYVEVKKEIYDVCKSSYNKLRYIYKQEEAKSVIYYENMDFASFNNVNISSDIIDVIYTKILTKTIIQRISTLPSPTKDIAECCFLKDMSVSETARLLNIPRTTVSYQKERIRKFLKEEIIKKHKMKD